MLFSGALEKIIHEQNLKQKPSWFCPIKPAELLVFHSIKYYPKKAVDLYGEELDYLIIESLNLKLTYGACWKHAKNRAGNANIYRK
jgi:hypothetical protein